MSHEDIVTNILSKREIIKVDYENDDYRNKMYSQVPAYDLTNFLKTRKDEPGRWGNKYIFVK